MNRTCFILVVGFVAVVLAAVLGSCRPEPSLTPLPPAWPEPAPPDTFTYTIVAPCNILDWNGKTVGEIRFNRSTPFRWINETQGEVAVFFEPIGIFGSGLDHIYLPTGASRVTIASSSGLSAETGNTRVRVVCGGIAGPTPPVYECPPPPPDCP